MALRSMGFWAAVAIAAVVALAMAAALSLPTLLGGSCGDEVLGRYPSPDGSREAVVFERNCGATTNFSQHVDIVQAGRNPDGLRSPFVSENAASVTVHWTGPRQAVVVYGGGARVFRSRSQDSGVAISYAPQGSVLRSP